MLIADASDSDDLALDRVVSNWFCVVSRIADFLQISSWTNIAIFRNEFAQEAAKWPHESEPYLVVMTSLLKKFEFR